MAEEHYIDVTDTVDTWYPVFSPHHPNHDLNRWQRASTEPGRRHVYLLRRAGLGVMQIEGNAFGAFCEYWEVPLPRALMACKKRDERPIEWGILWDAERMRRRLQGETLMMGKPRAIPRQLDGIPAPVYIQPGYFSCVAVVKIFLNIDAPDVQTPGELEDYLIAQGAERV